MRKKSTRVTRLLCALSAASASAVTGRALANSGIQLPLNQFQAGQEQTTPVATNPGFEANGMGNVSTPTGWTRTGSEMFVDPVHNAPPLNPGAIGSFSAQTRGVADVSTYEQPVTGLAAGKNYILSAYVWNAGEYDAAQNLFGDLATVKIVDPGNPLNSVSMTLEGKGSDVQRANTGRFMYALFNEADTAGWSGVQVQVASDPGTFDEPGYTRPTPWAQYDNIAITPAETFVAQKWLSNTSGNWSDDTKWSSGVNPNVQFSPAGATALHAVASFTDGITSNQTITVDQPRFVGVINFNNPTASYTIAGTSDITMAATVSGQNTQGVPEIAVISGSHTISAPITLARNLILDTAASSTLTLSGDMAAAGKTIFKRNAGTARLKNLRAAGLEVTGGTLQIIPNGQDAGVSNIGAITTPLGGKLDLTDNKLVTASPVGTLSGTSYTGITGEIQVGRGPAGGTIWDGATGIVTSQTAATIGGLTSVGVATGQQVKGLATATDTAVWAGQTVTGSDTLVMYTYAGDANLDGKISISDYGKIDFGIGIPGASGWYNGDFNYDGKISILDYGIIDFNIGIQGTAFPTGGAAGSGFEATAVPEPSGVGALAIALAGALSHRRRRQPCLPILPVKTIPDDSF